MGYMDLDQLSSNELVSQFILERQGRGLCLPYKDLSLVQTWLQASNHDVNRLLLILSDLIPEKAKALNERPLPLKVYHKRILERLKTNQH
ncbi:MAG: hypothetical protein HRU09_12845 [Oligoflexales bacterium]|nr:hypothetical protein [Oligoflexales bacterium]